MNSVGGEQFVAERDEVTSRTDRHRFIDGACETVRELAQARVGDPS